MKDFWCLLCALVLIVVVFLALGFLFQGADFFLYSTFAPKYEKARRETFEESKAYRQGMVQEMQNMQFQYEQASKEHKEALSSLILHRAADFKEEDMPRDLSVFIHSLRTK